MGHDVHKADIVGVGTAPQDQAELTLEGVGLWIRAWAPWNRS